MFQQVIGMMGGAMIALFTFGCQVDSTTSTGGYATTAQAATGTGPAQLRITNASNESIMYIYMSPCSEASWGDDLLGSRVLPRGATEPVPNIAPGCWDLRCVDGSQNYKEWRGQMFEAGGLYDLTVGSEDWVHD